MATKLDGSRHVKYRAPWREQSDSLRVCPIDRDEELINTKPEWTT
jgi:hypothetical protein